ncbi:MAG: TIGR03905 family TSCPD domain-containing protein [Eubacteriales bacterium]
MERYKMAGTCAREVNYTIDDENKIRNVKFINGCDGNLKGLAILLDGMEVDEAIKRLDGITCGSSKTSCPDQLAKALIEFKSK